MSRVSAEELIKAARGWLQELPQSDNPFNVRNTIDEYLMTASVGPKALDPAGERTDAEMLEVLDAATRAGCVNAALTQITDLRDRTPSPELDRIAELLEFANAGKTLAPRGKESPPAQPGWGDRVTRTGKGPDGGIV